jgi:hypothetical protein
MATQAELDALEAAAIANAQAPLSATVDGNSVTQRSSKDLADAIALASQQGVTDIRQLFGFHRTRLIPAAKQ